MAFTVGMCTEFEKLLYQADGGADAQAFLEALMEKVQHQVEETNGSIEAFSGHTSGADWCEFPEGIRSDLGERPWERPNSSKDPYEALRVGMYFFDCVEGHPMKCRIQLPPASRIMRSRTLTRGEETMQVNLFWTTGFDRHLAAQESGVDSPAKALLDGILGHLQGLWSEGALDEPGSRPVYIRLPDGLEGHEHGRYVDHEPFRQWFRASVRSSCGGAPGEKICYADLPPHHREEQMLFFNEGTEDEIELTVSLGEELENFRDSDESGQEMFTDLINGLMTKIQNDIKSAHGSVHELRERIVGADWVDYPEGLQSDLGDGPEHLPDPQTEGPDPVLRQYFYECRPGAPVTCLIRLPLTNRVRRTFTRNAGTEDQVAFSLQWSKEFDDFVSIEYGVGQLFLEHVLDELIYAWRFRESAIDGMHYGDDLTIQVRDLQQGFEGTIFVAIPEPMSPDQLGNAVVILEVEGEGLTVE